MSAARFGSGRLDAQCRTGRTRDNRSHAASEGRGRGSDLAVNGQVLPEVLPEPDSVRVFSGFAALSDPAFTGYRRSMAGP